MKRWNQKGTAHAKERMAELRQRKQRLLLSDLIDKWAAKTGRNDREWWPAAQATGVQHGDIDGCIAFLREQTCEAA